MVSGSKKKSERRTKMRAKLTSLLLLAIFLISLFPATMAQQEGNQGDTTGNAETSPKPELRNSPVATAKRSPELTAQLRAKLQERLNKLPEKARLRWDEVNQKRIENVAKLKELKDKPEFNKFKKELNFKVRQVNIEKLKEAKQNYGQAVKNLVQAREKSKEAHQAFLDAKQNLKTCTENCGELEAKTLQNAKDFLIRTADSMISHLEKVKTTLQSNEDLTDEEVSEMITKIDAQIKELQDAKAKVEAATTKAELKEASKTILDAWRKINRYTLFHIAKIVNARHGGIIVKLKHLELRLQKVLEKMEENGKDTSTIQPLVDEFNQYLEEAKTKFDLAEQKFKDFKALPEPKGEAGNKLIQEAQGYMKEARDSLKNAQEKLKEIVKAVKDAKGDKELAETTTEEAEEDLEETDTE
jgi:chromosome segregation ATPase